MTPTPGPWFVGTDDAHDCPPHKESGLALVDTGRESDWPIARLCEWNNAHLIAAAPELLGLARGYLAYLHAELHSSMGEDDFEAHPVVAAIRAAIKKAEGA